MIKGLAIWEHQSIHRIWVSALINKSIPPFGQHGHLGLRYHKGNSVCVACRCGCRHLHPIACGRKYAFNIWIQLDGRCSWGRVRLNLIWGSCNHEFKVTERCLVIIRLLWLGISLGYDSLQVSEVFFFLPPVLVFPIRIEWLPHLLSLHEPQENLDSFPR